MFRWGRACCLVFNAGFVLAAHGSDCIPPPEVMPIISVGSEASLLQLRRDEGTDSPPGVTCDNVVIVHAYPRDGFAIRALGRNDNSFIWNPEPEPAAVVTRILGVRAIRSASTLDRAALLNVYHQISSRNAREMHLQAWVRLDQDPLVGSELWVMVTQGQEPAVTISVPIAQNGPFVCNGQSSEFGACLTVVNSDDATTVRLEGSGIVRTGLFRGSHATKVRLGNLSSNGGTFADTVELSHEVQR